jgi:hypothetical protein
MPCRFFLVLGRRVRRTGWIPQQRDKREVSLALIYIECHLAVTQADLSAQNTLTADELEEDEAPATADADALRCFLGPAPV